MDPPQTEVESCTLCNGKDEIIDGVCFACETSWYEEIKNMTDSTPEDDQST